MYDAGVTLQPHRVLSALRILLNMGSYDTARLVCQDHTIRSSLSDVVQAIEEQRYEDAKNLVQPRDNNYCNSTAPTQHCFEQKDWKGNNKQQAHNSWRNNIARAA